MNMNEDDRAFEPDPVIEAYKKDVDRTLLRENLRLTVQQRLDNLVSLQKFGDELQKHLPRKDGDKLR